MLQRREHRSALTSSSYLQQNKPGRTIFVPFTVTANISTEQRTSVLNIERAMLLVVVAVQLLVAGRGGCQDVSSSLETEVDRQGALLDQLQAQLAVLTERVASQEQQIAFNARFRQRHGVPTPSGGQSHVLVFDHADLNFGRGYHTSTGIFTTPVSGLYLFSLKIAHTPPGNMQVQIMRDGVSVAEVEASGSGRYMDRSTADVALRLSTGQEVWTEWVNGTSTQIEGSLRSGFTGVLLKGE